ncbi:MAG: hypothetical protein ACREM9_00620, partial [Gemmatimonadales bacterium]
MRRVWAPALLAALLLLPGEAAAQRRSPGLLSGPLEVGPRIGRDFENKAWSVGGQLAAPLGRNLELRPSGDLFFPRDEGMGWQLNGDAAIRFGEGGGLYGGGGIAFVHPDDSDTETGYNLFFGLSTAPPDQRTKAFVEFRWTFVDDNSP